VKFIGPNGGRCVKLFSWEEVRPLRGTTPNILVSVIVERFHFQFKPTVPVPPDTVINFADGSTDIDGALIPIQKLDIYTDGFAVECMQTEDAKSVSDEIVKWAQTDLGYRDFVRPPKVIFQSQVVVEFAPEFENLFKAWKKLQSLLNDSVQNRYGFNQNVDVYRLQWRGDAHTVVNNTLVSDFSVERKVSESHGLNRWVCTAPLPTDEWLALLESIEKLALSK
jgi:hypothetical protein